MADRVTRVLWWALFGILAIPYGLFFLAVGVDMAVGYDIPDGLSKLVIALAPVAGLGIGRFLLGSNGGNDDDGDDDGPGRR